MYSINIIYLLLLVAVGWYWLNSIRVLELAREAGRTVNFQEQVFQQAKWIVVSAN